MLYGMIGYYIPHSVYPKGYHCTPEVPLSYICLASQKNYLTLYMMSIYDGTDVMKAFRDAWLKTGRWQIDIAGQRCPATAHTRAPFDPKNERVRA